MLPFSYLGLQARIFFGGVSDKSGGFLFLPCSHTNVVAQMFKIDVTVSQAIVWILTVSTASVA